MSTFYVVYKMPNSRTWGVFEVTSGKLVEGGFFSKTAAEAAAREWNAGRNG